MRDPLMSAFSKVMLAGIAVFFISIFKRNKNSAFVAILILALSVAMQVYYLPKEIKSMNLKRSVAIQKLTVEDLINSMKGITFKSKTDLIEKELLKKENVDELVKLISNGHRFDDVSQGIIVRVVMDKTIDERLLPYLKMFLENEISTSGKIKIEGPYISADLHGGLWTLAKYPKTEAEKIFSELEDLAKISGATEKTIKAIELARNNLNKN